MTAQTKTTLKGYFNTSDTPSEANFADLIDTIGTATLVVAANDASNASKGRADYVCDGTDDDVQIQAAIDALTAGGRVVLSEGTFSIGTTITDNNVNGVILQGAGASTILQLENGATTGGVIHIIHLTSVNYWQIKDMKIDGNKAGNTTINESHCILLTTVDHSVFENLIIINARWDCFDAQACEHIVVSNCTFDAAYNNGLYLTQVGCDNNLIVGCWAGNNENDMCYRVAYGLSGNVFLGCTAYNPGANGFQLLGGPTTNNIFGNAIIGCVVDGNETTPDSRTVGGIRTQGDGYVFNSIIKGNYIKNCRYGIYHPSGDAVISGNSIRDCDDGIFVASTARYALVSNNLIDDIDGSAARGNGISIDNNNSIVAGNYIVNCNRFGIDLLGDNTAIIGNSIVANATGIRVASGADNTRIAENVFSGNTTADVEDNSSYTNFGNNVGYVTENEGAAATIADGGTIAHGLSVTPTWAQVTPTVANEFASVTGLDGTNITVAIKKHDSSAGTSQTIYWRAGV